ncbi:MAG: hypothetical protein PWR26_280 [Methanosarcinales archaeon]|nr:MAG: hypothetical protein XD46_0046 [Euryarchaeota archaeon 55_53]MDI3487563.1 hypothetical protein [Methanosarcinales archaeon]MDN5294712.1 hypothetical protein [Methanosarcinales archaeon]
MSYTFRRGKMKVELTDEELLELQKKAARNFELEEVYAIITFSAGMRYREGVALNRVRWELQNLEGIGSEEARRVLEVIDTGTGDLVIE